MSEARNDERVDSTRLQQMARAYCDSALLWAALDLHVFTHVGAGARDNAALADACGISRLNADRLVSCLLALDLLRLDAAGGLVNAPDTAKFLVRGTPGYAGPWMRFTRPDVPGWMNLTELLRSPEPPRPLGMYSDLTVEQARGYHQATASIGMGAGRRFCRQVDLGGRRHLLDLGGGSFDWLPRFVGKTSLGYRNDDILVIHNFGTDALPLPPGEVLEIGRAHV